MIMVLRRQQQRNCFVLKSRPTLRKTRGGLAFSNRRTVYALFHDVTRKDVFWCATMRANDVIQSRAFQCIVPYIFYIKDSGIHQERHWKMPSPETKRGKQGKERKSVQDRPIKNARQISPFGIHWVQVSPTN